MEPPVSEPSAHGAIPAVTAAAEPPPEPPGTREGSQGLRDGPYAEFSVEEPIANSSVFVLPSSVRPAALQRSATVESNTGTYPARIFDPAVVSTPFVEMTSLSAIGTPSPSAPSTVRRKQWSSPSRSAIASRYASRSSGAEISPRSSRPFASSAVSRSVSTTAMPAP